MGRWCASRVLCLLLLLLAAPAWADDDEAGFEKLFDGKTLEGWDGNPEFWSVRDEAITGQTTTDRPTKGNTFLIWRGGEVGDFELRLRFRIDGGNSGIQYRSKEQPNSKWVIGGYQADFDGGNSWTGTLYEERGRGILAKRGQKVEIPAGEKPKVVGETTPEAEIVEAVKKGEWNDYTVIAQGNHLVHKVNGLTTIDVVDNDEEKRAMKGLVALQLHAGPPMTVQFKDIRVKKLGMGNSGATPPAPAADAADEKKNGGGGADQASDEKKSDSKKKKVIFLAGGPSHGFGAHDHLAGCKLLAAHLEKTAGYETEVHYKDWPNDVSAYKGADCVVMYSDGGGGHPVNRLLKTMDEVAKSGTGMVCIHYAVEVPKGESGDKFLDWIGGYFETHYSVNPHWVAKFDKFPDHPVARGVKPFQIDDEWYYYMRFRPEMKGVTPILSALPPASTLSRPDGPHSGNPEVRRDVLEKKEPQHVAWVAERENKGRGFGFTGGHNHWNWGDDNFRKVVLNAIVWCAHGEVPQDGVSDKPVTLDDLLKNPDEKIPDNFDKEAVKKRFDLSTGESGATSKQTSNTATKPVWTSKLVSKETPGHAVDVDVDLTGAKQLYLVVNDAGNGFGCDRADWAEPRLVGEKGELKLTELKWKRAASGFGSVQINKNCSGGELKIDGKSVAYGIGTHANSVIAYDLPAGYTRLKARAGLDNGGTNQGCGSSVVFAVFTAEPPSQFVSPSAPSAVGRDAADAVGSLDVAEGLEAQLFSSEPDIANITSIDIDQLGRVWACEVRNYRKWSGTRPEGDRILILEDTNGDNKADKQTVFYQGRDIDSAHGICVLGNRVIVSALDKVLSFYDDDGDLKSDRKEVLFSGISGAQHDHGIHAVAFGPDGKLYFNFGNEGKQLKDKDGNIVVDLAGNEVKIGRNPYQEGMVFRCDPDGSNVETLGWNFRNNWEVTFDSYGGLWQSDNDDDGNKGVRINYVLEFGNYGYKDEFTGAGWQQKRENLEQEIPLRHWHLNDPGVVPNLIQTGAGSPTGIVFYEGSLLPKQFHNQPIHCDAGPNVCRAYISTKDGAGYKAEMVNILHGARDNWFRPSDVCTAPDGSIFVADWYDPGVGGHNQQEIDKGRIFRVAPPGHSYKPPKFDFSKTEDCIEALKNPNLSVRHLAFTSLQKKGHDAEDAIETLIEKTDDPRVKARAIWVLGKIDGEGEEAVEIATKDSNPDIRIVGIRLARQLGMDVTKLGLAKDSAPEVRRELAIALRHSKSPDAPKVWAELASQHDGKDRWYLEALGIGAGLNWDACLSAWLDKVGSNWNTPAGRDIVWRSRSKQTPALLAKLLLDDTTSADEQPRYLRAFDFLTGPEKDAALKSLLE